jgi:hypothetical protein
MPPQQRVRRDNRRDFAQSPTAQPVRPNGQSAPLVVGEVETPSAQLAAKDPVFLDEIPEGLAFSPIEPACQRD